MKPIISLVLLCACLAVQTLNVHAMQNQVNKDYVFAETDLAKPISGDGKSIDKCIMLLAKYKLSVDFINKACTAAHDPQMLIDPHVGDTSCEIRAHFAASMATVPSNNKVLVGIQAATNAISTNIANILAQEGALKSTIKKLGNRPTFAQLLSIPELCPRPHPLPPMLKHLKNMLLLTEAKQSTFNFSANTFNAEDLIGASINKKWAEDSYGITSSQFKNIVETAQEDVARRSISYLQNNLGHLEPNIAMPNPSLITELNTALGPNGICLNTTGRDSAAYLPLIITLYGSAIQKNIPLLLKIMRFKQNQNHFNRISQLYVPHNGKFEPAAPQNHLDKKAMILEALSFDGTYEQFKAKLQDGQPISYNATQFEDHEAFKTKLNEQDLLTNLYADASMHPQFTDSGESNIKEDNCIFSKKETLPNLAARMQELQTHAYNEGVCKDNMSFFYLKHVFADTLEHQLNQLRNNND